MRMRLWAAAGFLWLGLTQIGCDNTTAGQLSEDPNAPRLVRIMIQDDAAMMGRGLAVDLLSTTPGASCSDIYPCPAPIACGSLYGHYIVEEQPTCHDPQSVLEVMPPIGIPALLGGSQIRLVFSKLLNPNIDTLDQDAGVYLLPAGLISLFEGEEEVMVDSFYDVGGSPDVTSDPVGTPFGPALVMKPYLPLHAASTYTIRIDPTMIVDRKGQMALDSAGNALPSSFDFTMEGLFVMQSWNCPSQNCVNAVGTVNYPDTSDLTQLIPVAMNEGFQFLFNADIDETTVGSVKLFGVNGPVPIRVFNDLGMDPTACADYYNPRLLDIVPVTEEGGTERADLPEGEYLLTITGILDLDTNLTTMTELNVPLLVVGEITDPMEDPFASVNMLLPEECEQPEPTDDGGVEEDASEPLDGGVIDAE